MKHLYKKLLTAAALSVLAVSTSKAQAFPESFEGATFPPTGWAMFDNGIGTVESWSSSTFTAQAGTQSAYIQYENVTTGIAEDWLVSPTVAITPTANVLSFWERETYTANWGSVYKILVSTSSQTNIATFTTVVTYTETMTNPLNFRNRIVNLSAYNGQTVYIAFKMENDDGDDWYIDNIQLTGGCTTPPVAGSVTGPTSTNIFATNSFTASPSVGNIQWITASSLTGPWTAVPGATTSPQNITANTGGTMYVAVVASSTVGGCISDTTNNPLAVTVNFPGDNVCNAIPLAIGPSTVYYQFMGASVQPGEVSPTAGNCSSQYSWCNNTLNNTRWFSFVAPASGYVTIQSPDFDTQLAVWKAASCNGLLSASTATLISANDDDPDYTTNSGVLFSSFVHAGCLTPGATYYIQADSYSPATSADSTRILITTVSSALDASFSGLSSSYCLPATSSSLTPVIAGGMFTQNTSTVAITSFSPSSSGSYTINYSIGGCKSSSVTTVGNTPNVSVVSSNSLICTGQTVTLTASGTATSYSWNTGGTTASIVVSPSVTTSYTVTGSDFGCTSAVSITQNVSACTGINEFELQNAINVYPNPNTGLFTLTTNKTADLVTITDLLGKVVLQIKPENTSVLIDVKSLNQGVYFVLVKEGHNTGSVKIVKN